MSEMSENKKRKRNRKSKKISFEEEVVCKDDAKKLLSFDAEKNKVNGETGSKSKKNKRRNKQVASAENVKNQPTPLQENAEPPAKKKKKRNANKPTEDPTNTAEKPEEELDPSKPEIKKTESMRDKKRKRHQKLMEEKKQKNDLNMQQLCLNYLSQWKHTREIWKFEKLKQIWLQQNMFDNSKVPDTTWETLIEYFNNSKGKARKVILDSAMKMVEAAASTEEVAEEQKLKCERARNIVQSLQE